MHISRSLPLFTGKVKQEPSVYRDCPPYQRRGSLQLWQFLVTLLDDPANGHFIAWTGRGMEFKLIEPEEVRWEDVLLIGFYCNFTSLNMTDLGILRANLLQHLRGQVCALVLVIVQTIES